MNWGVASTLAHENLNVMMKPSSGYANDLKEKILTNKEVPTRSEDPIKCAFSGD